MISQELKKHRVAIFAIVGLVLIGLGLLIFVLSKKPTNDPGAANSGNNRPLTNEERLLRIEALREKISGGGISSDERITALNKLKEKGHVKISAEERASSLKKLKNR